MNPARAFINNFIICGAPQVEQALMLVGTPLLPRSLRYGRSYFEETSWPGEVDLSVT